jgi:DNA-binding GntR family transcriptional regulator
MGHGFADLSWQLNWQKTAHIARTSLLIGRYDMPTHNHCSVEEHRAILAAIAQGDAKLVMRLMEEHLED